MQCRVRDFKLVTVARMYSKCVLPVSPAMSEPCGE